MPNEIRHKTSTTAGAAPTAAQLVAGELAINAADGKVYTRRADGTVVDLTDLQVMDGGEQFTPLNISNLALWLDGSDTTTLYQTQAGGAAAVTAPTDIAGCFAWWDAADASTLTVAPVTNRISQWTDKVGGRNFTASTTAAQPLRETGTLNGRNVVRFEVTTYMTVANDKTSWNFLHQPTGGGWLFMVLQPFNAFSAEQWGRVIGTSNFSSANVGFDFFIDDRYSNAQQSGSARIGIQRGVSGTNNASALVLNSFPNDTGAYIVAIKYDPGNATAAERLRLFINGVGGANITTNTDAASTANASGDLTLGIGAATTGFVAEILIYNTLLTDVNRARIEKYLALKWGITSVTNTIAQDTAPITAPLGITNNTCALWLDGADANTMYNATTGGSLVTTNSAVLRWEDKSGNGRHATQSNSSVAPLRFLGGLNSRDVLSFNATRGMTAGAIGDWNFLHNAEGGSVFMVVKPAITADPQDFAYLLQTQNNTSTQVGFGLFYDDRTAGFSRNNYLSSLVFFGTSGQSVSFVEQNNFFTAANTYALVSVVVDSGCSSPVANRMAMYREGTRLGSNNTQTNPPSTSNSATALQIGVTTGANSPGEIAEIIIFRRPLSDVDRARVENYLAAKWGLSVPNSQPPVGSWQDRSGNSRHATQATAANRPALGAPLTGSRCGVSFGTTGNAQRLGWLPSSGTQNWRELIAVGIYDVTATTFPDLSTIFSGFNTNSGTGLGIGITGEQFQNAITTTFGTFLPQISFNNRDVFPASAARPFPTINSRFFVLGRSSSDTAVAGYVVGNDRQFSSGRNWRGRIAEVIVFERQLTLAERNRIIDYLAAKWSINVVPQVANLDAQDWINRVYAAGSTVTPGTAAAVNTFCNAIDSAGLRDRFYRLNLFCGNDLTACLVPLYRGPSLTATQLGNTTDVNTNFVAADYNERNGLQATATGTETATKSLNSGAGIISALPNSFSGHISACFKLLTTPPSGEQISMSFADAVLADVYLTQYRLSFNATAQLEHIVGGTQQVNRGSLAVGSRHFAVATRQDQNLLSAFLNGGSELQNGNVISTTRALLAAAVLPWFGISNSGNPVQPSYKHIISSYTFGLALTSAQVAALNTAMQTFNTALGRT